MMNDPNDPLWQELEAVEARDAARPAGADLQDSGCPICGKYDRLLNDGPEEWLVCDVHRLRWWYGSNWLSENWRQQDEAARARVRAELLGYEIVRRGATTC